MKLFCSCKNIWLLDRNEKSSANDNNQPMETLSPPIMVKCIYLLILNFFFEIKFEQIHLVGKYFSFSILSYSPSSTSLCHILPNLFIYYLILPQSSPTSA